MNAEKIDDLYCNDRCMNLCENEIDKIKKKVVRDAISADVKFCKGE